MALTFTRRPTRQGSGMHSPLSLQQRLRLFLVLLVPAAVCSAQGQAPGGTGAASATPPQTVAAAPVRSPEMEKTLKSVEELVAALDAQIKNLEAKYLLQRKQAADAAVSSAEKEAAATSAAKLADLLKATTKERDALAVQIASLRSLLGLPSAAATSPEGTPGATPSTGSGK